MKSVLLTLTAAAVLGITASAHADTVETISVTGDGGQLYGTFYSDLDTTSVTGTIYAFDGANTLAFNLATDIQEEGPAADNAQGILLENANFDQLLLAFAVPPGPSGFVLCSVANPCFIGSTLFYSTFNANGDPAMNVNDGQLEITDITSTPEPSSIALLGTGLLSMLGVARRRLIRA